MLQSFDPAVLRDLRARLGEPARRWCSWSTTAPTGDRMVDPAGLREISTYAQGIGPSVTACS